MNSNKILGKIQLMMTLKVTKKKLYTLSRDVISMKLNIGKKIKVWLEMIMNHEKI